VASGVDDLRVPSTDVVTLRVAGHRMIDLDHVGAPVGERGPGRRNKGPGGDLDDPDVLENIHDLRRFDR